MLKVSNLNVSIGGSQILRGVSFDVPDRSVFCLMGRNGVGKTTTLKSIVGLQSADSGAMRRPRLRPARPRHLSPSHRRGKPRPRP
jgi:ABC-type branched-subunit amino acid transport system ATPase component